MKANVGQEKCLSQYNRHSNNQYQNHNQNLMLDTAINVVKQQKEFFATIAEKFGLSFQSSDGEDNRDCES